MIIAKVVPLRRLPAHLDWFDYEVPDHLSSDIHVGMLIQVPFQKTSIQGIVFQLTEKSSIDTPLKSVEKILNPQPLLGEQQKKLLTWFSDYYGVSKASCIKMMIPPSPKRTRLSKKSSVAPKIQFKKTTAPSLPSSDKPTIYHSTDINERLTLYMELAQTTDNSQILFLSPTVAEATTLAHIIEQATQQPVAIIHGERSLTDYFREYTAVASGDIKIITGTRTALFCNIPNLKTIIIDQSEREEYKQSDQNPRYDTRTVAYQLQQILQCRLILTSPAPRIEDWHDYKKGLLHYIKSSTTPHSTTVNLKDEFTIGNYTFLGDYVQQQLTALAEKKQSAFIFINRKGASLVVCKDCDYLFTCTTCNTPLRYFVREHKLICSTCKIKTIPSDYCPKCGGNNYKFPGLGIEKIAKIIQHLYPSSGVVILEQEDKKKKAGDLSTDNTIFVGTSFAIINHPEIFQHTRLTAVISADPVPSMIDYRSHEHQWQTIARLTTLASINNQEVILQSFNPSQLFTSSLETLDYERFADQELRDRTTFNLPPSSTYIDLLYRPERGNNRKNGFEEGLEYLKKHLKDLDKTQNFPKISINIIKKNQKADAIRLQLKYSDSTSNRIPAELLKHLASLPQGWMRDIDPSET